MASRGWGWGGWILQGSQAPWGEDTERPESASPQRSGQRGKGEAAAGPGWGRAVGFAKFPGAALERGGEEFQDSEPGKKVKSGHGKEFTGGGSPTC